MTTPNTARESILSAIRAAKKGRGPVGKSPKLGIGAIPERGRTEGAAALASFISEAERSGATTARVPVSDGVPGAVQAYLSSRNTGLAVRLAPAAEGFAWHLAPGVEVLSGPPQDGDGAGLSVAFGGVAETGTLVLLSGPENPTRLNLLPETHIIVLEAAAIEGAYEDVWKKLRAHRATKKSIMPRTVNWITGPSRTADIEQTLLMGAHGPKDLHIIIVGE